jgi:agmatine/peptidylarginine deiminase
MAQDWLLEMKKDVAHEVMNLLQAVSEEVREHDYPHAEDVDKLNESLAHQSSLAVQRAELILEWMRDNGINLSDRSASDALEFLQQNVPRKYLVFR